MPRRKKPRPDISYLHERFVLIPSSGVLIWRPMPMEHFKHEDAYHWFNENIALKVAGSVTKRNHRIVNLDKAAMPAAHIVYAMTHGEWPKRITHLNGDTLDNRPENIAEGKPTFGREDQSEATLQAVYDAYQAISAISTLIKISQIAQRLEKHPRTIKRWISKHPKLVTERGYVWDES